MIADKFAIKGFKEGLLINLGDGNWEEIHNLLLKQIDDRQDFFRGAKIALDVNQRALHVAEIITLRDQFTDRGVELLAVISKSNITEAAASSLGLSTNKAVLHEKSNFLKNMLVDGENAILFRKTLRSGASIKYPGHVVIVGDVNPGAEIQASGSIFVWGKLRGNVSAGIDGSEKEIICALELNPTILRIGNITKEEPKVVKLKLKKAKSTAQKAEINNGKIEIHDWDFKKSIK